jgi:hypothetical protein
MADALADRVARLEAEVNELRALVDELSVWVTGARASAQRKR